MSDPLAPAPSPWLASTVTSFAILASGAFMLTITRLTGVQPRRWRRVYWLVLVVGCSTVGYHGWGEPAGGLALKLGVVADSTSNLLLALAASLAAMVDLESPGTQWRVRVGLQALTAAAIAHVLFEKFVDANGSEIQIGGSGALSLSQLAMIANYVALFTALYRGRERMPDASRRLLPILLVASLASIGLAAPHGDVVTSPFFAWHALFHLAGTFLLLLLWALNEIRFGQAAGRAAPMDGA